MQIGIFFEFFLDLSNYKMFRETRVKEVPLWIIFKVFIYSNHTILEVTK